MSYITMTIKELNKLLVSRGIGIKGSKSDKIAKLTAYDQDKYIASETDLRDKYRRIYGHYFPELVDSINNLPNLSIRKPSGLLGSESTEWTSLIRWTEFDREIIAIGSYEKDMTILRLFDTSNNVKFTDDVKVFARSYPVVTWVYTFMFRQFVAIKAVLSIVLCESDLGPLSGIYDIGLVGTSITSYQEIKQIIIDTRKEFRNHLQILLTNETNTSQRQTFMYHKKEYKVPMVGDIVCFFTLGWNGGVYLVWEVIEEKCKGTPRPSKGSYKLINLKQKGLNRGLSPASVKSKDDFELPPNELRCGIFTPNMHPHIYQFDILFLNGVWN